MYSQGETFFYEIDDEEYEMTVLENFVLDDYEYIVAENFDGDLSVFIYDDEEDDVYLIEDSIEARHVLEYWKEEYVMEEDIGSYDYDDYDSDDEIIDDYEIENLNLIDEDEDF